ncbi:MAG: BatA domain-containing protein [Opitutales bacterium]
MNLFLANPWGLLALLGLPALVLIHFFQRRSRRVVVSTLFLIEDQRLESRTGRRFERWRGSRSFWLQVLAVLLLTWFLVQPRWIREDTVQRIVVVLDDSFSMAAFKPSLGNELTRILPEIQRNAAQTEWILLPSSLSVASLYQGNDAQALLRAFEDWQPVSGEHGFTDALRLARARAGVTGRVLLLTDHPQPGLDPAIERLSVGEPIANLGFAGGSVSTDSGQPLWRVFLRNYGTEARQTTWRLQTADGTTIGTPQPVRLNPAKGLEISGAFPAETERVVLVLDSDDRFALDNRIALTVPRPKRLPVALSASTLERGDFLNRLADSLPERVLSSTDPGDAALLLRFATEYPTDTASPSQILFFGRDQGRPPRNARRLGTTESHPLMEGLAWQGLTAALPRETFAPQPSDEVLFWFGERPAIFLRPRGGRRDLVFNFDPVDSNLARLPAFVLLCHRYAENVRRSLPQPEVLNAELGQPLSVAAADPNQPIQIDQTTVSGQQSFTQSPQDLLNLRAPLQPGFFTVTQNGRRLLDGASQFADPREADFANAASQNTLDAQQEAQRQANSQGDHLAGLWILLAAASLLGAWWSPRT